MNITYHYFFVVGTIDELKSVFPYLEEVTKTHDAFTDTLERVKAATWRFGGEKDGKPLLAVKLCSPSSMELSGLASDLHRPSLNDNLKGFENLRNIDVMYVDNRFHPAAYSFHTDKVAQEETAFMKQGIDFYRKNFK